MSLDASLDASVIDDGVAFELTVENTGSAPETLSFSDAMKADFAVLEGGAEIWRFSNGRMAAQMISEETLDPGASETYRGRWETPKSGTFTVVGTLRARNQNVEARTNVSV